MLSARKSKDESQSPTQKLSKKPRGTTAPNPFTPMAIARRVLKGTEWGNILEAKLPRSNVLEPALERRAQWQVTKKPRWMGFYLKTENVYVVLRKKLWEGSKFVVFLQNNCCFNKLYFHFLYTVPTMGTYASCSKDLVMYTQLLLIITYFIYCYYLYLYFIILILFQNIHVRSISQGIPHQTYTSTAPTLRYQTTLTQL